MRKLSSPDGIMQLMALSNTAATTPDSSGKATQAANTVKPDYGLHTLVHKDPEAFEHVDIIAVHGLNGHYLKTWTDENTGVNWLKDIIPRVVPAARVMSFWYNSTLQFSKSTSDILDFAHQLLENIIAARKTIQESYRPIIFICHSLGGLVFKQAFNIAKEDDKYLTIEKHVQGVMFFGTPHRGSGLASWANIIGNVLKTASFGTSTNVQLARDLEPESKLLKYISESLLNKCGKLKIVSCYETSKMEFLNRVVVNKFSATLGISTETVIALDGDHRNILDVHQLHEAFLMSLNKSDYVAHKNRNPLPVEGTCTWILNHSVYEEWVESPDTSLLWISADPGCGKSVLASFLVDHLSSSKATGMNICYFFFKSDNIEQADAMNGIAALHQLYTQQTDLIATGVNHLQGGNMRQLKELWNIFVRSVEHQDAHSTVCILDGIDECHPELRGRLLQLISEYFAEQERKRIEADSRSRRESSEHTIRKEAAAKFKMLVTSRPEIQIKIAFQIRLKGTTNNSEAIPGQRAIARLRGEDETDAISGDVTKVVHTRINELICQGLPIQILRGMEAEIVARANRTFLWVSLILSLLEQKVEAGASRRELDALLKNRDIYNIYSELLSSRSTSQKARKVLMIILAATRPLRVDEISVALAVTPEDDTTRSGRTTFDDIEYDLVHPFENHIKSLCGHFIRIIRQKVYFVHETAREFLLKEDNSVNRPVPAPVFDLSGRTSPTRSELGQCCFRHSFTLTESQHILRICATYLYCLSRKSKDRHIGTPSADTKSFLDYAAKSWVTHFQQVGRWRQLDCLYYQNLCHPFFPGFHTWIAQYWSPHSIRHTPGSADEVQDFYIDKFGLYSLCSSDRMESLDEDDELDREQVKRSITKRLAAAKQNEAEYAVSKDSATGEQYRFILSSNPGSLSNHYFPVQVNSSGFVSLDFSDTKSSQTKAPERRRRRRRQ
ncbi:hypothetical protein F5Y06DRAFT_294126 [Hypoxylon sp. FL0890]|nr:hypothetical protein F5Y06DRAFT_294126 [Hypoxylon sp. FL0890]